MWLVMKYMPYLPKWLQQDCDIGTIIILISQIKKLRQTDVNSSAIICWSQELDKFFNDFKYHSLN